MAKEIIKEVEETTPQPQTEAQVKGRYFEGYILDRFNKKYFKLKTWRSDKSHNGRYAETNRDPDMIFDFCMDNQEPVSFAVECKWRKSFQQGAIRWATDEQIEIYNKFSKEHQVDVIVAIGLGGEPSSPETVYVLPLRALKYSTAKEAYLTKFKREDPSKMFYYDKGQKTLK